MSQQERIRYRCPACGHQTMVIDASGGLVCSWLKCKNPCALHDQIEPDPPSAPTEAETPEYEPFTVAHRGHCPWHDTVFIEWRPGRFCCALCAVEKRTTTPAYDTEAETLRAALERVRAYAKHFPTCAVRGGYGYDCDCGLSDLLASLARGAQR